MTFLLLAILLGILTYWVIRRGVAPMTRTPVWLLWSIIMTPVFVVTAWMLVRGPEDPPGVAILSLFLLCPLLYTWAVLLGRLPSKAQAGQKADTAPPRSQPAPLLDRDGESRLRQCFPLGIYFLKSIEHRPQMMICRGRLQEKPEKAYTTIQKNVEAQFGKRFWLVLQEGRRGEPFFSLMPRQGTKAFNGWWLALGLLLITLGTTTLAGIFFIGGYSLAELRSQPSVVQRGLAYSLSLMLILGVHELGHYLMARRYQIPVTPPFFIPIPGFLGTFGAFIRMRAPVPHRRALFDVGLAGPLAGLAVTLPVLLWGLAHSQIVEAPPDASLLNFEAVDPSSSILLALLSKLALGSRLQLDQAISLHPVAVAGCLGLVVTALNLIPVGQLDGGHVVHAMYGRRMGANIGYVSRLLVALLAFIHPEFLLWAVLLLFTSVTDEPALNDLSELDARRDLLGLASITLLALIVLPLPAVLASWL